MRQPKIFIRLPSNGDYWPAGSLEISETGEYPVYSMTAKDELMLKIPDAVMNGQAVVEVLQHCMPNIKNAWLIPQIDIDIVLIAIRLATYGEKMTTPITITEEEEMDYVVDLREVMDTLQNQISWNPIIPVNENLTVFVRPMNYKQISETALKTFETQKIMQIANDSNMDEDTKLEAFKESFKKLTDVTLGMVQYGIYRVDTTEGTTENPEFIKEFIDNIDKNIFNTIQSHIDKLKEQNSIKPIKISVTESMKEKGITGEFIEIPITFDPATFFV
jgi:hypothetical protein